MSKNSKKEKVSRSADLPDSAEDALKMKSEKASLDLPDVKDIPGQEHVRPLPEGEMADTTISSADEEGSALFNDEEEQQEGREEGDNVTREERELLEESESSTGTADDLSLRRGKVDNRDEDGTLLNEAIDNAGSDLDVPGSEADDADEEIGEGDEENNPYSLNDDKEDDVNTRQ